MGSLDLIKVDDRRVAAFRLARHLLSARSAGGPTQAAAAIGGLQAQVMSAAELQAWSRVQNSQPGVVATALWDQRSLVRTWSMRGTLHLMASADLATYVGAHAAPARFDPVWLRAFGVTQEQMDSVLGLLPEVLDRRCLSRKELAQEVGLGAGTKLGGRLLSGWGEFLKPAARRGLIVQGPPRGQEATFVRADQWLGGWTPAQPEAARREWVRRYLSAYGPATPADYARWMGVRQVGPGRATFQALAEELIEVESGGGRAWLLARDRQELAGAPPPQVRLLAAFDPYLLGHVDRSHVIPREHLAKVSRTAGWISSVVLVEGMAAATWTHAVERGSLRLAVTPFGLLTAAAKAGIRRDAERLAGYFGTSLSLTYT